VSCTARNSPRSLLPIWQAIERIDGWHAHRPKMPHVSRKNCKSVPTCGRRNRNVGKSRGSTAAACQIRERSRYPCGRKVEDKNATCVKMQEGFKPRRQVGGLATGLLSTRLCYSIFDFRNCNCRNVETVGMLVHPRDEIGRSDGPARRTRRNHIGVYEIHERNQNFTRRIGLRFRRGRSFAPMGADMRSRPNEGT